MSIEFLEARAEHTIDLQTKPKQLQDQGPGTMKANWNYLVVYF